MHVFKALLSKVTGQSGINKIATHEPRGLFNMDIKIEGGPEKITGHSEQTTAVSAAAAVITNRLCKHQPRCKAVHSNASAEKSSLTDGKTYLCVHSSRSSSTAIKAGH